jgi:hypothetical protein
MTDLGVGLRVEGRDAEAWPLLGRPRAPQRVASLFKYNGLFSLLVIIGECLSLWGSDFMYMYPVLAHPQIIWDDPHQTACERPRRVLWPVQFMTDRSLLHTDPHSHSFPHIVIG